jgi:hypothetical protein
LYSLVRLDLQDFVGGFEVRDRSFTTTTMKIMCVFKPPPTSLLEVQVVSLVVDGSRSSRVSRVE